MITQLTLAAIAIINDIANLSFSNVSERYSITSEELSELLSKLENKNIICQKTSESPLGAVVTYKLTQPKNIFSLLNILEATGEHFYYDYFLQEEIYMRSHNVASQLRMLNQITRIYLSRIKLTDF